jgi:hypothetical protein
VEIVHRWIVSERDLGPIVQRDGQPGSERGSGRRGVRGRRGRNAAVAVVAAASGIALVAGSASAAQVNRRAAPQVGVIVMATPGHLLQARQDVVKLGGAVGVKLRIANSFAARIPSPALVKLRTEPGIARVVLDGSAH